MQCYLHSKSTVIKITFIRISKLHTGRSYCYLYLGFNEPSRNKKNNTFPLQLGLTDLWFSCFKTKTSFLGYQIFFTI